jgi:DNA transformation protein
MSTVSGVDMEMATDRPVVDLKNIGPITARHLHTIGVMSEAELRRLGPVAVYRRIKHVDPENTTIVLLYALQGALTDTHWNDLPKPVKQALQDELQRNPAPLAG